MSSTSTYQTIRGAIFYHDESPYFFSIDAELLKANQVRRFKDLLKLVETNHNSNVKKCWCNETVKLQQLAYIPAGPLDLYGLMHSTLFDDYPWRRHLLHRVGPNAVISSLGERMDIFAESNANLSIHFIVLATTTTLHKMPLHSARLKRLSCDVFESYDSTSRPGKRPSTNSGVSWPVVDSSTIKYESDTRHVYVDRSHVYRKIGDGFLTKSDGRYCISFASLGAPNASQFPQFISKYHGTVLIPPDPRLPYTCGMLDHACLELDFSVLASDPDLCEEFGTITGEMNTYMWWKVTEFLEKYDDVYITKPKPSFDRHQAMTAFTEGLVGKIRKTARVLVTVHGLDSLVMRFMQASMAANKQHRLLPEMIQYMDTRIVAPLLRCHKIPNGPIYKIIFSGKIPLSFLNFPSAVGVVTDISRMRDAGELHGLRREDIRIILEQMELFAPEDIPQALRICEELGTRVDGPDARCAVFNEYSIGKIVEALRATPLWRDTSLEYILNVALKNEEKGEIGEYIYWLMLDTMSDATAPLRETDLSQALASSLPDRLEVRGAMATTVDEFSRERSNGDWHDILLGVLFANGYIVPDDAQNRSFTYAGPFTRGLIANAVKQFIKLRPKPSQTQPQPGAFMTPESLQDVMFKRFYDISATGVPLNEENLKTHILEHIRDLLEARGIPKHHAQVEPLLVDENGNKRADIMAVLPDEIWLFELGHRLPVSICSATLDPLRWKTRTNERLRREAFASGYPQDRNLQFVRDLTMCDGLPENCFVNEDRKERIRELDKNGPEQYRTLAFSELHVGYNSDGGPKHVQNAKDYIEEKAAQGRDYIKVASGGIRNETSFKSGITDARITLLSDGGQTKIKGFLALCLGFGIWCCEELGEYTINGTVGVVGIHPWTNDRLKSTGQATVTTHWNGYRGIEDVRVKQRFRKFHHWR